MTRESPKGSVTEREDRFRIRFFDGGAERDEAFLDDFVGLTFLEERVDGIVGGPDQTGVGDVEVLTLESGNSECPIQELAADPAERALQSSLCLAGCFSDKQILRASIQLRRAVVRMLTNTGHVASAKG